MWPFACQLVADKNLLLMAELSKICAYLWPDCCCQNFVVAGKISREFAPICGQIVVVVEIGKNLRVLSVDQFDEVLSHKNFIRKNF